MLWHTPRASDGAPIYLVCSTAQTGTDMKLELLALLFDGDPRETIEGRSPLAAN